MSTWISVDRCLPATIPDEYGPTRSVDVLATNGQRIFVAYLQEPYDEDDEDRLPEWFYFGPDGYRADVTHWRPLPELP